MPVSVCYLQWEQAALSYVRRRARAVRIHRQARRPRPALHALAHRPGRHRRPRRGDGAPRRRLPNRSQLCRRLRSRCTCAAAPTATIRRQNLLEEIKTYRGQLSTMPDNHRHLHWAQLRVYGHLLCAARGLDSVNLALVYYDIGSGRRPAARNPQRGGTGALFEEAVRAFRGLGRTGMAHRAARDAASTGCASRMPTSAPASASSPKPCSRPTARALPAGAGADRHRQDHRQPVPGAESGAAQRIDKIFFFAAKTPGRQLALDAAPRSAPTRPNCRCACWNWRRATRPASIPTRPAMAIPARWRRVSTTACPPRAGRAAMPVLDREAPCARSAWRTTSARITSAAKWRAGPTSRRRLQLLFRRQRHAVRLALANQWRVSVLVDEAHNMVLARAPMYSCELDRVPCAPPAPPRRRWSRKR
jgi:DNA excision repair protein ERCC-2